MNVVNLRSALDTANAMGLDDLDKFSLTEQTRCHLPGAWRFHPPLRRTDGFARGECGARARSSTWAKSEPRRGDCDPMDSRLLHRGTANVSDRQGTS